MLTGGNKQRLEQEIALLAEFIAEEREIFFKLDQKSRCAFLGSAFPMQSRSSLSIRTNASIQRRPYRYLLPSFSLL